MMDQRKVNKPIAKSYSFMELTGWFGKWFHIPAGTQGIIINASGNFKLFPPGKRPVISPWARLTGKGVGMHLGYFPPDAFDLPARVDEVLCGDDEFVDITLHLYVKVIDPLQFFNKAVIPVGELTELPDISIDSVHDEIQKVTQQYTREDVIQHVPTSRLVNEIRQKISNILNWMGLELLDIPLLFFRKSEDRLILSEKLAELESKLTEDQSVNPDNKKSEQSYFEEVTKEVFPETSSLRSNGKKALGEIINDLRMFKKLENNPKRHWLLQSLNSPDGDEFDQKTRMTLKKVQSLQTNWIAFLLLLGIAISYILFKFNLKNSEMTALLIGTWGTIISFVLASLKKLVEKKEAILLGTNKIANLEKSLMISHDDRSDLDRLVRQQCANELKRASEIVNESRSKVYQSGRIELALALKDFENELSDKKDKFLSSNFGAPFYLSGLPISESDWRQILDHEEGLLRVSKTLGSMVEKIRISSNDLEKVDIQKVRQQLLLLEDRFFDRSRVN